MKSVYKERIISFVDYNQFLGDLYGIEQCIVIFVLYDSCVFKLKMLVFMVVCHTN